MIRRQSVNNLVAALSLEVIWLEPALGGMKMAQPSQGKQIKVLLEQGLRSELASRGIPSPGHTDIMVAVLLINTVMLHLLKGPV